MDNEKIEFLEDELDELEELEELLQAAITKAKDLKRNSKGIFKGQIESYLIGTLESFIDNESQCGSVAMLRGILEDSKYDEE